MITRFLGIVDSSRAAGLVQMIGTVWRAIAGKLGISHGPDLVFGLLRQMLLGRNH